MSISSEINRIGGNVSDAFDAVDDMGGTVPSGANSDDLATAIRSIPQSSGGAGKYIIDAACTSSQLVSGTTINMTSGTYQAAIDAADIGQFVVILLDVSDIDTSVEVLIDTLDTDSNIASGIENVTLSSNVFSIICTLNNDDELGVALANIRGKSAYEVAVDNGFTGNESAWLASLKGETGDKGDKGDPGSTGATMTYDNMTTAQKNALADLMISRLQAAEGSSY